MFLAINIGNSNIHIGVFNGMRLQTKYSLPAKKPDYITGFKKIILKYGIESALICSVVPQATKIIEETSRKILELRPYVIGRDISVPIKNLYRKPKMLGQDRLVNAYAAAMLYGTPVVIIDFGTAITFDIVSSKNEYLGGMILAGIRTSLEALAQKTALLPKLSLENPKEFIGRNTKNSILSGTVYGFARLTDGLITQIKDSTGKDTRVIACGGDAEFINAYCRKIEKIDLNLTLKGINLIYQKIK